MLTFGYPDQAKRRNLVDDLINRGTTRILGISVHTLDRWSLFRKGPLCTQYGNNDHVWYGWGAMENRVLSQEITGLCRDLSEGHPA